MKYTKKFCPIKLYFDHANIYEKNQYEIVAILLSISIVIINIALNETSRNSILLKLFIDILLKNQSVLPFHNGHILMLYMKSEKRGRIWM